MNLRASLQKFTHTIKVSFSPQHRWNSDALVYWGTDVTRWRAHQNDRWSRLPSIQQYHLIDVFILGNCTLLKLFVVCSGHKPGLFGGDVQCLPGPIHGRWPDELGRTLVHSGSRHRHMQVDSSASSSYEIEMITDIEFHQLIEGFLVEWRLRNRRRATTHLQWRHAAYIDWLSDSSLFICSTILCYSLTNLCY